MSLLSGRLAGRKKFMKKLSSNACNSKKDGYSGGEGRGKIAAEKSIKSLTSLVV